MSIEGQGHFLPYIFQVLYVLCFTGPRYQVSVYRTIGPLVYGTLISMSMTFMDSMSMVTVQTLSLQQMSCEAAIELAPKAILPQRQ